MLKFANTLRGKKHVLLQQTTSEKETVVAQVVIQKKRQRCLKKDVLQGFDLVPLFFNVDIHDLPQLRSRLYVYANGLAKVDSDVEWISLKKMLNQNMAKPSSYLRRWKLKLSKI